MSDAKVQAKAKAKPAAAKAKPAAAKAKPAAAKATSAAKPKATTPSGGSGALMGDVGEVAAGEGFGERLIAGDRAIENAFHEGLLRLRSLAADFGPRICDEPVAHGGIGELVQKAGAAQIADGGERGHAAEITERVVRHLRTSR